MLMGVWWRLMGGVSKGKGWRWDGMGWFVLCTYDEI